MAHEELKQRQSVMWGNGPYQNVTETLIDIHERVIEALAPAPGDRWLDIATGTGAIAELAAAQGASCTGLDLAPDLIATAKERAEEQGLEVEYVVGDAERMEFEDGSFDKVLVHLRNHVHARPRGLGPRAGARHGARRPDWPRQLDAHGRPREDVQGHGAVPAGASSLEPVRLGR